MHDSHASRPCVCVCHPCTRVVQEERVPRTDFEIPYRELTTKELIGQGAFGRVFNGKWRGTPVAIKMLVCQHLTPDVVKEFRAEVAVLRCVCAVLLCLWRRNNASPGTQ